MNERRFPWDVVVALVLGIALGLVYAWIISPVQVIDSSPEALRADFKDEYRAVIAAAYASNGDLPRAQARLALLGDENPYQALSAQAQQMLAAGTSSESVQQVAGLAAALQGLIPTAVPSTPTKVAVVFNSPAANATSTAAPPENVETAETETPLPFYTATPRPTQTLIPTPGKPFEVASQESLCDETLTDALLMVITQATSRRPIPGVELIVSWTGGEEHFFTGLKPELGNGYADYQMAPGVVYILQAAQGGATVTDLTAPVCQAGNGETYYGQILVTLQRP